MKRATRASFDSLQCGAQSLDAGAYGFSTGLFTPPGAFAATDEIVALAKIVSGKGGRYFTHLRDEANAVFEALDEAITVGREAHVHVQVVHMKLSGLDNFGRADEMLGRIEAAREAGVAIDCDQYPYTAASNPLKNLLPRVDCLILGGGIRYTGGLHKGTDGAVGTPDHTKSWTVYDAVVSYPVNDHFSVRLNGYNLFDKKYVAAINKSGYRYSPGTPRTFLLSVDYRF